MSAGEQVILTDAKKYGKIYQTDYDKIRKDTKRARNILKETKKCEKNANGRESSCKDAR